MNQLKKIRKKYGANVNSKDLKCKKNRGRKKAENEYKGDHNKKSPDNIIKKVKGYFAEFLIIFVNAIINREKSNKEKIELKSLNHKKYIDKIKKSEELRFLKMTVKEYLSLVNYFFYTDGLSHLLDGQMSCKQAYAHAIAEHNGQRLVVAIRIRVRHHRPQHQHIIKMFHH